MAGGVVPAQAGTRYRRLLLLGALALSGCSNLNIPPYWPIIPPDLPPPRIVGDSVDGSTVDVVRTQMIQVRLPADANSANRWTVDFGKDRLLYPAGDTPRYEGPVDQVFTFRAEGVGTTSVRFAYHDPAQPQTPPARSVAFDVVAR